MKHPFYLTSQIEIEKNGECFLDVKRFELLKAIKRLGSINAASRELKMSYQQAWSFISRMNEMSTIPLVVRQRGGSNGGGAEITAFGERTINEFEKIRDQYGKLSKEISDKLWLCIF
jgi:molybdate transport system regulatory protein